MATEQNLVLRPVEVNVAVDIASYTEFVFLVRDAADKPVDLNAYKAVMQMRPYPSAKRLYDELTTENGRIEVADDRVCVTFPEEVTETYKFDQAAYDLYLVAPGGQRYRLLQGVVRTTPMVTTNEAL